MEKSKLQVYGKTGYLAGDDEPLLPADINVNEQGDEDDGILYPLDVYIQERKEKAQKNKQNPDKDNDPMLPLGVEQ